MPTNITHAHATKINAPCRIYDTYPGLHLWIKTSKSKYWIFRTSRGGKRTDLSLGKFPDIGPSEARKKAGAMAQQVKALGHAPFRAKTPLEPVQERAEVRFQDLLSLWCMTCLHNGRTPSMPINGPTLCEITPIQLLVIKLLIPSQLRTYC